MSTSERRQENKFIVYTDIVGHTKMLGRLGMAFKPMRERHDELFRLAVAQHADGAVVKGSGDGFYAAFDDVDDAIEVALSFRRALATEDWNRFLPEGKKTADNHIRSRVGIHSGQVSVHYEGGIGVDFDGRPRNVCEKVMSKALGNQVLVTRQVRDQGSLNFRRNSEVAWQKYGEFKLRDVPDTVEIWGLGEAELHAGNAPQQDPEHRVIIFAVVHDLSALVEQAGPQFEALKDKWDATFQKAVDAHSRDAFIKRLPEGSLAAFRTAIEAVRAARDFRRMWKAEMRTSIHRLEPKTALDSGLVTFSYENNRPSDVRDQPVNMAAKVAKTGLTVPWQLLLTRPVREDAFSNMPERDEFAWVCVGRKMVPGEPEPVELWDFQDVQAKKEDRAVLWVDLAHIRDDLKSRRDVYIKFVTRLDTLLADALGRRAEQAWTLQPDAARIAAFRDPVEAVQAAMDLRAHALAEDWGQLFKNRERGTNLLKIAIAIGSARMTSEDGQRKEIKGPPVDAIRCLIAASEVGQLLVTREFKEAVARHLPEKEVAWRQVDVPAIDDVAVEGFEIGSRKTSWWDGLAPAARWSLVGVGGVAAVLAVAMTVKMMSGGGGGGGGGGTGGGNTGSSVAGKTAREAFTEFNDSIGAIPRPDDAGANRLRQNLVNAMRNLLESEQGIVPVETAQLQSRVVAVIGELGRAGLFETGEAASDIADALPLDGSGGPEPIAKWIEQLEGNYRRLDRGDSPLEDPRKNVVIFASNLKSKLNSFGQGGHEVAGKIDQAAKIPAEIETLAWIGKHRAAIEGFTGKAFAKIGPQGDLRAQVDSLTAGSRNPVPDDVRTAIEGSRRKLRTIADIADEIVLKRARELDAPDRTPDQMAAALEPMRSAITKLSAESGTYDIELFIKEKGDELRGANFDQAVQLLTSGAAPYKVLEQTFDFVGNKWSRRMQSTDKDSTALPQPAQDKLKSKKEAAENAIKAFPKEEQLRWVAKNESEIAGKMSAVDAAIKEYEDAVAAAMGGPAPTPAPTKYGPLPTEVTAVFDKLDKGPDAIKAVAGKLRKSVQALWDEAERERLPRDVAEADLRQIKAKIAELDTKREAIAGDELAKALPTLGEPGSGPGTMNRWLTKVLGFVRIEGKDPRKETAERLAELRKKYIGDGTDKLSAAEAPDELLNAERTLANIAADKLPWIEANRAEIEEPARRVAGLAAAGGSVEKALEARIAGRKNMAEAERARGALTAAIAKSPVVDREEPELSDAWREHRAAAQAVAAAADVKAIEEMAAKTEAVSKFLAGLAADLKRVQPEPTRTWSGSVAAAMRGQRGAAIKKIVAARGTPAEQTARQAYADALSQAEGFIKRWSAIQDAFARGMQLAETVPVPGLGDKRLGDVIDEALAGAFLKEEGGDRDVKDALATLKRRAEMLKDIATIDRARGGTFAALVDFTKRSQSGFETRVAVWNTMQYAAYADDPDWLRVHEDVFRAVEEDLKQCQDTARVNAIKARLAEDKPKRWFMRVERLRTAPEIRAALERRDAFGITDAEIAKAAPSVRWNLLVYALQAAAIGGNDAEVKADLERLRKDAAAMDAGGKRFAAFVDSLAAAEREGGGAVGSGGGALPDKVGPAATNANWTQEGVVGGPRLEFTMTPPRRGFRFADGVTPKLTFVQIPGTLTYICTTELSVRVAFETLLAKTGANREFTGLSVTGNDSKFPRTGPFTWDFSGSSLKLGFEGGTGAIGEGGWIKLGTATIADAARIKDRLASMGLTPPTPDMPMTYLSARSALYLALSLGCRLPTSAEWRTAASQFGGGAGAPNLRDASYGRVFEFVKSEGARLNGMTKTDKEVFGMEPTREGQAFEGDDGVPLFRPVGTGGGECINMIGNVAELVCEQPEATADLAPNEDPITTFVKDAKQGTFAVIGHSAIGIPKGPPTEAVPLQVGVDRQAMTTRGWSDVGARLAFTVVPTQPSGAPVVLTLSQRVVQTFRQHPDPFLPPG